MKGLVYMAKMYTLGGALLTGAPEVRIGDKVFHVDNRVSTVKKLDKVGREDTDAIIKLAYGDKEGKEIIDMDMPFPAYLELVKLTIAAMTGEDAEEIDSRFQKATAAE